MNLLMVTLAYAPAIGFGGPVKVVQDLARELVRRGHRVTVYCTNRLDKARRLSPHTLEREDRGVRVVYHYTWFAPAWDGNFGPSCSPGMWGYLMREGLNFDLIHVHEARAFSTLAAGIYAGSAHIPYLIQAHGSFAYGFRARRLKRLYDALGGRQIYRRAARVIALQPEEIAECEAVGVSRERITVIGNGIDLSAWKLREEEGIVLRKRLAIPDGVPLVLFLGRLDKKKGADLLIEALARHEMPEVYCLLAGPDDGQRGHLEQLAQERGLDGKVIFTGLLPREGVRAAFAAADMFVLPSRYDTFPMAAVEACASGLPILTTESCQIAELIRDRAGLVTTAEAGALAAGLRQLLMDLPLRKKYGQGARALAESEFSLATTVDRLEAVYRQVLGTCQRS